VVVPISIKFHHSLKEAKKGVLALPCQYPIPIEVLKALSAILGLTILGLLIYLNFDILDWICSFPIHFLLTASYFCN
jgi:hypothetical protein